MSPKNIVYMCVCVCQKNVYTSLHTKLNITCWTLLPYVQLDTYIYLDQNWSHAGLGAPTPLQTKMAPLSSLDRGYVTNGVIIARAPPPVGDLDLSRTSGS